MNVTLGLLLSALRHKECPMAFIAVQCPHCHSEQIVKRGKTGYGTQRYLCQNATCRTVKIFELPFLLEVTLL
jgi:hypothetical protein